MPPPEQCTGSGAAVPESSHRPRSFSSRPSGGAFETGLPVSRSQTSPDTSATTLPERSSRRSQPSPASGQRSAIRFPDALLAAYLEDLPKIGLQGENVLIPAISPNR